MKLIPRVSVILFLLLIAYAGIHFSLRPALHQPIEIFPGITYSAEKVKSSDSDDIFLAVTVIIDLTNKNLSLVQPTPHEVNSKSNAHYKLQLADIIMLKEDLDILINTTPFHGEIDNTPRSHEVLSGTRGKKQDFLGYYGYPGRDVWTTEPIVTENQASHIPKISHLLWFDENNTPTIQANITGKELSTSLENGKPYPINQAFGFEVIHVDNFKPTRAFFQKGFQKDRINYRTFIGINKQQNKLFLIAFENITTREMIDYAIKKGAETGGQMDSGNATWLIFGHRAKIIFPHSGMRGGRPIAGYLGIKNLGK